MHLQAESTEFYEQNASVYYSQVIVIIMPEFLALLTSWATLYNLEGFSKQLTGIVLVMDIF